MLIFSLLSLQLTVFVCYPSLFLLFAISVTNELPLVSGRGLKFARAPGRERTCTKSWPPQIQNASGARL